MKALPVVPSEGFNALLKVYEGVTVDDYKTESQLFWHMGNALDTIVTYLVQANQGDPRGIVVRSYDLYNCNLGSGKAPGWWRDDYGWWGIAFLNAAQDDHAKALGWGPNVQKPFFDAAKNCWDIMNFDWTHHRSPDGVPLGVRNNPKYDNGPSPETNTITNVLFLMLSLRLYETRQDTAALKTAGEVFDWFYRAQPAEPPPDEDPPDSGLFNSANWIRYLPGDYFGRAWSADQGWFWRACLLLLKFETDPTRLARVVLTMNWLKAGIFNKDSCLFGPDGIVRENIWPTNFNSNFCVGPGVFMREFALINDPKDGQWSDGQWSDLIRRNAEGAWQYSGWENELPNGCWYDPDRSPYKPDNTTVWKLALKTSAQDAFNAYMTVQPV